MSSRISQRKSTKKLGQQQQVTFVERKIFGPQNENRLIKNTSGEIYTVTAESQDYILPTDPDNIESIDKAFKTKGSQKFVKLEKQK